MEKVLGWESIYIEIMSEILYEVRIYIDPINYKKNFLSNKRRLLKTIEDFIVFIPGMVTLFVKSIFDLSPDNKKKMRLILTVVN